MVGVIDSIYERRNFPLLKPQTILLYGRFQETGNWIDLYLVLRFLYLMRVSVDINTLLVLNVSQESNSSRKNLGFNSNLD